MKPVLSSIFQERTIGYFLFPSLLLLFASWVFLFYGIHRGEGFFVIHYNIYFGVDRIGAWHELFVYPLTALAIFCVNTLLALWRWPHERLLGYFLLASSFLLQAILLVEATFIVLRNT